MSGTQAAKSKAATVALLQNLIAGLQKRLPNGAFTIGNAAFTTAALITLFQELLGAIAKANDAQVALRDAAAALRDTTTKVRPVFTGLRSQLVAMYRGSAQTLGDFGIVVKTPAPLSAEKAAAKVAKAQATRKARGTTSKKQKLAVKGNVTGVSITPVTVPEAASPPLQTAPSK